MLVYSVTQSRKSDGHIIIFKKRERSYTSKKDIIFHPLQAAMVMSGQSVYLTTLFSWGSLT